MKTASTRSLTVLAAAALLSAPMAIIWAIIWAGPGAADSIGAVYNMDRMLSEPHPLADQYGTRWQPAPASAPVLAPVLAPGATPSPFLSPQPGTAPEPPPTTFAPPEPPPFGKTAPPAPPPQSAPVAKVTPVESLAEPTPEPATRPLEMAPRLSIDAGGVDLEPASETPEPAGERQFEQPGAPPPLPPG